MNLLFRVIVVLWRALWAAKRAPLDPSELSFRVLPNDLDPNWHMNNGRYLTIMDLGRLDITLHSGLMRAVLRNRWMPVLGAATIRYHRPLAPFQRYSLTTRIIGWDEKWIYMEQLFESNGKRAATALVKALIRGKEKSVPTAQVMHEVGVDLPSPPFPEHLRAWIAADEAVGASSPR